VLLPATFKAVSTTATRNIFSKKKEKGAVVMAKGPLSVGYQSDRLFYNK
jgi:hypothetical protein